VGEHDDILGLVLRRLEGIERKLDRTFEDMNDRIKRVESYVDGQQLVADLRAARAARLSGHLATARTWITFGLGSAAGVLALHFI
jgi:hypothetical protein